MIDDPIIKLNINNKVTCLLARQTRSIYRNSGLGKFASMETHSRSWKSVGSLLKSHLPKSPLTYILFCVFGAGSWVAINGLWAEISVFTRTLPECNCLPAVIVVVIQIANIGPFIYTLIKVIFEKRRLKLYWLEVFTVFIIVSIGTVACVCLAIFWDRTATLGGAEHSVSLIVISFFLALVDCTSSVVFIPFMKHFPSQYISALFIGEGLSGVIPSVVALSQGSVNNSLPSCLVDPSSTDLGLNFSPNAFFGFLLGIVLACGIAFLLINTLPQSRRLMQSNPPSEYLAEDQEKLVDTTLAIKDETKLRDHKPVIKSALRTLWSHLTIYICLAVVNFMTNGALPAISAFALFPYGSDIYHVAINLALLANPLMCFLYVLLPHKSPVFTAVLSSLAALLGVYMLVCSISTPPPLNDLDIGKVIVVCVYVSISGTVSYAKVGAVTQLHTQATHRDTALLLAGWVAQLSSLVGAVIFFIVVYFTTVYPSCDQ